MGLLRRRDGRAAEGSRPVEPCPRSGEYFDDQSPYADRLTLAESFACDDETRPTAQDLRTYQRLTWYRGWLGHERDPRRRH